MGAARRPSATEAAERARDMALSAPRRETDEEARERYRARGTLVSAGEVAEALGGRAAEVVVVTYRFSPGGRIQAPVDVVVRCVPSALEGVRRSMARLLESRGWASEARERRERVPASELGEFADMSDV